MCSGMTISTTPIQSFSSPERRISASLFPASSLVRSVSLTGPAGGLEALLNEGIPDAPYTALLCHPHPLGGGTMHNKVVYHAMKAMNNPAWGLGLPVLRFNFRGTGLSQGTHDGNAETGDVLAALEWLENAYNLPIVVAGFSFGAAMAIGACCGLDQAGQNNAGDKSRVRALVALGLPTHASGRDYAYPSLADCTLPKLFISGDQDQFAPTAKWRQVVSAAAEPKTAVLLPGADHFFGGQLEPMQAALSGWLKEQLL
jgi:alpha/beta superfamily hydrolase